MLTLKPTTEDFASGAAEQTMSSREIADLCEKEHKHVLRDIRTMLIGLYGDEHVAKIVPEQYRNRHSEFIRENADEILNAVCGHFGDGPNWDHDKFRGFRWSRDNRGYIVAFELDRSHTMTLVAGYKVKLRKAIIDRWEELERKVRSIDPLAALNDPAAMRGLLLTYTEKVLALEAKNTELSHKADALDRIATADGSLSITEAAKGLQMRPKDLFDYLQRNGWIYRRTGGQSFLGYQSKTTAGLLEHKITTILRADGSEKVTEQVRITARGLSKLAQLIKPMELV